MRRQSESTAKYIYIYNIDIHIYICLIYTCELKNKISASHTIQDPTSPSFPRAHEP